MEVLLATGAGNFDFVLTLTACGVDLSFTVQSSDEPELPDTTGASMRAYLNAVDYQNNDD